MNEGDFTAPEIPDRSTDILEAVIRLAFRSFIGAVMLVQAARVWLPRRRRA